MNQRFFRASETVYEQVRATLDAAWGNPGDNAITCFEPAATAPRDAAGSVVLAVADEFCGYAAAAAMLPILLESGAVEEIDEAAYTAALWVKQNQGA